MSSQRLVAYGMLAALVVIWGGNYTWVKLALRDISPWTFNAIRYAAAATLVAAFLAAIRSGPILPLRGERCALAMTGLLQAAVTTVASSMALQWIEASRVVLIIYSMPIWTLPLSAVLLGERATLRSVVGAVLGVAGIVLLTNPFALSWTIETVPGIALSLTGVLGWALGAVLYRRRAWLSTFWQQTFWQLAISAIVIAPLAIALEHAKPISLSNSLIAILIYNIVGPTALGFWLWARVLSRLPATMASQLLLLSPVFGMWQSQVVLGEPRGPWIIAAAAAIVCGAWLAIPSRR